MLGDASCNVCDDGIQERMLHGEVDGLARGAHNGFANACPNDKCRSRPRTKTFRLCYDEHLCPALDGDRAERRALEIAGVVASRRILEADFAGGYVNAALVGRPVVTDLRDLKEFADGSFEVVTACMVLDYILELDDVFSAVLRVLTPGGSFIWHIDDRRLTPDDDAPVPNGWLEKLGGYYPDDYRVPSILVGERWLLEHATAAGFSAALHDYTDIFSGDRAPWFLARKPA